MELKDFLVKAKVNGYANKGEGGEVTKLRGGKELRYELDGYLYLDLYFGFDPFIGEEIVRFNDQVVWGMNYYGGLVSKTVDSRAVYIFLKKALSLVTSDRPFRGPTNWREGDWKYSDQNSGDINSFSGQETISFQGEEVYRLKYQGGVIK